MRHFDVQLIGGITLHEGKIAEMRTGEGKTLMSTLAGVPERAAPARACTSSRSTSTSRSATRTGWARSTASSGSPSASSRASRPPDEKRAAYACDITYGTNNEFGFDYLRDNLAFRLEDRVQRGLAFAIVDEVDSILIDEARTPLIISGPAEESTELYLRSTSSCRGSSASRSEERRRATTRSTRSRSRRTSPKTGHEHVEQLMAEAGLLREGESLYDPRTSA